jgi:hypothetical protein
MPDVVKRLELPEYWMPETDARKVEEYMTRVKNEEGKLSKQKEQIAAVVQRTQFAPKFAQSIIHLGNQRRMLPRALILSCSDIEIPELEEMINKSLEEDKMMIRPQMVVEEQWESLNESVCHMELEREESQVRFQLGLPPGSTIADLYTKLRILLGSEVIVRTSQREFSRESNQPIDETIQELILYVQMV